jgi:hypothetical protein
VARQQFASVVRIKNSICTFQRAAIFETFRSVFPAGLRMRLPSTLWLLPCRPFLNALLFGAYGLGEFDGRLGDNDLLVCHVHFAPGDQIRNGMSVARIFGAFFRINIIHNYENLFTIDRKFT